MSTWADLLIGLLPFVLIAFLLWIRLRAAGVSPKVAAKFLSKVFVLVSIAIMGLAGIVKGWREGILWLLMLSGIATVVSILALRLSLQRMWAEFPLTANESEENGTHKD